MMDAVDILTLHLELAELLAGALDEPAVALAHWRRALSLDPSREDLLDEALRCAERTGGALDQLELLEHVVSAATSNEARARLLVRRGDEWRVVEQSGRRNRPVLLRERQAARLWAASNPPQEGEQDA